MSLWFIDIYIASCFSAFKVNKTGKVKEKEVNVSEKL